jgi:hypothetical protein
MRQLQNETIVSEFSNTYENSKNKVPGQILSRKQGLAHKLIVAGFC